MDQKHYLRPLRGKPLASRHLLLWVDADEAQPVLTCRSCRAWDVVWKGRSLSVKCLDRWRDTDHLDTLLDSAARGKGTLTIWLARGWEDLVLSGLAELMDRSVCSWRYAALDGQKILVRGAWRSKSIIVTSLSNWVGRRWTEWHDALQDAECVRYLASFECCPEALAAPLGDGERLFLATWSAIAGCTAVVGCTSLPPTAAGAAVQCWRAWLGPRFQAELPRQGKRRGKRGAVLTTLVAPSPYRPVKSAQAERHCCYGLTVRQLRRGLANEAIYCLDLRCAYALALATMPVPIAYERTLHQPSSAELISAMRTRTGMALVRVKSAERTYPVRRNKQSFPATGHFWTWLCGTELAWALANGDIKEIKTAHLWHFAYIDRGNAETLLRLSDLLTQSGSPALAAAWRAVYSSLVGQFAGRRRVWRDIPPDPTAERWSQWYRASASDGRIHTCRSIAGKCQELVEQTDTSASVPLVYACVTAHVRWLMNRLAEIAGFGNVLAVVADSLWVSVAGWQRLQRQASEVNSPGDTLKVKAIFDRGWFNGKHSVVVERSAQRYFRSPGCPGETAMNDNGTVEQLAAAPWTHCENLKPAAGVRRRRRAFAGQRLMDLYGYPAVTLPPGETLDDPLLPVELLEPARYTRTIEEC